MKRPLVVFVCLFMLGIAIGLYHRELVRYPLQSDTVQLGLCLIIAALMVFRFSEKHLFGHPVPSSHHRNSYLHGVLMLSLFLTVTVLGWLYAYMTSQPVSHLYEHNGETVSLTGKVVTIVTNSKESFVFDLSLDDGETVRIKHRGKPLPFEVKPADEFQVTGQVQIPSPRRNPGDFDYQAYLWRQGIAVEIFTRQPSQIRFDPSPEGIDEKNSIPLNYSLIDTMHRLAYDWRQTMERILASTLPSDTAGIIAGIIFGGQGGLSEEDQEAFRITGVAHAFAVSGSNVAVITSTLLLLLRGGQRWKVPLWPSIAVTILVIVFYGMMTGFPPSVQRAILMACGSLLAYGMQQRAEPFTLMAAAALPILIVNPLMLADPGFQLSFGATWGILYLLPIFQGFIPTSEPRNRFGAPVWSALQKLSAEALLLSLTALLAVGPLTVYYFNMLSLSGLLANLFAGMIIALVTILGFATFFLIPFWTGGAKALILFSGLSVDLLTTLLRRLSTLPGAALTIATPPPLLLLAFYLLLILVREFALGHLSPKVSIRIQTWTLPVTAGLMSLFILYRLLFPPVLQVAFVDVGQGDCILIQTPGGKRVIIDVPGPPEFNPSSELDQQNKSYDPGERVLSPLLNRKGITELDTFVVTHADQDHMGGAFYILQNYPVGKLILSAPPEPSEKYEALLQLASAKNIPVLETPPLDKDISPDPSVQLTVLNPGLERKPQNTNDSSLVLLLEHGQCRVLLTGDIDKEGQLAMVADAKTSTSSLQADIVKVPHHGSRNNLEPDFLVSTGQPALAVISVGKNRYGHPSPEVMQAWHNVGAEVLRTDRCGAITAESDGRSWQVHRTHYEPDY
ncbi:DNA internalization-related competence protein ComEC/Rec2 [Heliobacterium chlorum]|uniref:DNA internalization-related competence protein ComEC/Rec2 n=1 Tax=Heliobacterium chlorum TaxID=2698 RepID=A0ABR7T2M9_HELCL|nr:DNA internalization-related competence protein ComEC/Rec2 [Heliobacterium chlorum]MBC9785023.1 DNA internalization-related competence protein ComEC/Rec2 [Heliobacterium chlorum]